MKHLHSTMFLLIREWLLGVVVPYNNLHSTMFLLIPKTITDSLYVHPDLHSTMFLLIRNCKIRETAICIYLHSTMFLLILFTQGADIAATTIYIPLCFYLYIARVCGEDAYCLFTFHYVSTYTVGW